MPGGERRQGIARYAAPAAFLLAVTIAVLLIRSGLGGHGSTPPAPPPTPPPATTTQRTTTAVTTSGTTASGANYYVVQKGDTFGAIAVKENTTIAEIERLNPGVSSNALQVGQKIRVR
ncbi:MAG TPA: LysM domain-containing protein [Gaiellaceae bacterium]|nr:LysM domain-containing protein [Gaiellaceae bacterium]